MVKKFVNAKFYDLDSVGMGSGKVKREFLNVEDLPRAVYFCIKEYEFWYLNVGSVVIIQLKQQQNDKNNRYNGKIIYNVNYPDGVKKDY